MLHWFWLYGSCSSESESEIRAGRLRSYALLRTSIRSPANLKRISSHQPDQRVLTGLLWWPARQRIPRHLPQVLPGTCYLSNTVSAQTLLRSLLVWSGLQTHSLLWAQQISPGIFLFARPGDNLSQHSEGTSPLFGIPCLLKRWVSWLCLRRCSHFYPLTKIFFPVTTFSVHNSSFFLFVISFALLRILVLGLADKI